MQEIEFEPQVADIHKPIFKIENGLIFLLGGRAGMKTASVSKEIAIDLCINPDLRTVLIREQSVQIKQSIFYGVKKEFDNINNQVNGFYSNFLETQEREIKRINVKNPFSSLFLFGMQGSKNDLDSRMKGLEEVKKLVLEEASDIKDYTSVKKLFDTVRRNKPLIIVMFNTPPTPDHWTIDKYYKLTPLEYCTNPSITNFIKQFTKKELEGYYYPEPKRDDFTSIFTNLNDNPYLDDETRQYYLNYGNKNHPDYDLHHYLTDILGLISKGRKGLVFPNIKYVSNDEFNKFEGKEFYGLDFGFTNDHTALTHHKVHNNKIYTKVLIYKLGLLTPFLSKEMERLEIPKDAEIIADNSEPKTIDDLFKIHGWRNIKGSVKGNNSVENQIKWIKDQKYQFYDVDNNDLQSQMLKWENTNYIYAVDRNGNSLEIPDDSRKKCKILSDQSIKPDNIQDARRYAIYTHFNPPIPKKNKRRRLITNL